MLITADRIHDGRGWLPAGTLVELADDGKILSLRPATAADAPVVYPGVLCPGFVNAHCHLELSHMKALIPEATGLMGFLSEVIFKRGGTTDAEKKQARHAAYEELLAGGVVAVGDIANSTDTLDLRALGQLHIHTFIESLGFSPERAAQAFAQVAEVYSQFAAEGKGSQSIVPHAPYSVSAPLFALIGQHQPGVVVSVHNQETPDEDAYYRDKSGGVGAFLGLIGIDDSSFTATGQSSLRSYSAWLGDQRPLLLIHNTCTTAEDVQYLQAQGRDVSWCLCPNANLYIEGRLPDVPMLLAAGASLCVGTDSLSSNHRLSVLSELQTLDRHFPEIGWERLLQWATFNGAKALQLEDRFGSLEAGKRPGLVLLSPDYTTVQRIV